MYIYIYLYIRYRQVGHVIHGVHIIRVVHGGARRRASRPSSKLIDCFEQIPSFEMICEVGRILVYKYIKHNTKDDTKR